MITTETVCWRGFGIRA